MNDVPPADTKPSKFFGGSTLPNPVHVPTDVRKYLAQAHHWKVGFSACELATSWVGAGDIPTPVRQVLDSAPEWQGAAFIEGNFEKQVDLRTPGRPSQTDLMVTMRLASGAGILAVEGKVDESFGPFVRELPDTTGYGVRTAHLQRLLGVTPTDAGGLRYQLFHRTASALFEAERYAANHAVMLVHSFSKSDSSLPDFVTFATAIGMVGAGKGRLSEPRIFAGAPSVSLRMGWVARSSVGAIRRHELSPEARSGMAIATVIGAPPHPAVERRPRPLPPSRTSRGIQERRLDPSLRSE
ncbi:MAG: hypothetical protein IPK81_10915 [Rhodospirillales bacterium]|nr:MAG: hypothetical protein IPK81_10915 [Rhodospirillales bacterium]